VIANASGDDKFLDQSGVWKKGTDKKTARDGAFKDRLDEIDAQADRLKNVAALRS
jgi:hypothetical protein